MEKKTDSQSLMKHTPGPWEAVEWTCHAPITIKAADGTVVTDCAALGRHSRDCIADARLIAAAPDLLGALTALHDAAVDAFNFVGGANPPITKGQLIDDLRETCARARAAIEKADGE